jgi:hypothetical protein
VGCPEKRKRYCAELPSTIPPYVEKKEQHPVEVTIISGVLFTRYWTICNRKIGIFYKR